LYSYIVNSAEKDARTKTRSKKNDSERKSKLMKKNDQMMQPRCRKIIHLCKYRKKSRRKTVMEIGNILLIRYQPRKTINNVKPLKRGRCKTMQMMRGSLLYIMELKKRVIKIRSTRHLFMKI